MNCFEQLCENPMGPVTFDRFVLPAGPIALDLDTVDVDGLVVVSLLTSPTGAVDVGILPGTATCAAPAPRSAALLAVRWEDHAELPSRPILEPAGSVVEAGARTFRWHGGYRNPARAPQDAGLAVLVWIQFEAADAERLRHWTNLVLTALRTEPRPADGLVTAHFHLSDDGTTVANLATWTSENDYDHALTSGPPGIAQTDTPDWRAVLEFTGVARNTVTRFTTIRSWKP